jgi:hypothetical protein
MSTRATITTGYVNHPRTDLTRGYWASVRRDHADGSTVIEYDHMTADRSRVLVFDRNAGYRAGFLWVDTTPGGALVRWRNGERADVAARRVMCRN